MLQRQGKLEEAKTAFEKSILLGEKLGDTRHIAMVLTAYGKALLFQNKTGEAIPKLIQGFEIDEKMSNQRGLEIVTPPLVRALIKNHRREEAQTYYRRALDVAPRNKKILALGALVE